MLVFCSVLFLFVRIVLFFFVKKVNNLIDLLSVLLIIFI